MLGHTDRGLVVEYVAFEWEVLSEEVVADQRDTVGRAVLSKVLLFIFFIFVCSCIFLCIGVCRCCGPALKRCIYRVIETATVLLHKHSDRHIEMVVVPF